jgi:Uma2 family endonuclease
MQRFEDSESARYNGRERRLNMATVSEPKTSVERDWSPLLHSGDRLRQAEFQRLYEATPDHFKAELIGGIVYVASPLYWPHGSYHSEITVALGVYKSATPGVELSDNTSTILGEECEVQPDLSLRLLPEFGGRTRLRAKKKIVGPPELVVEISHNTRSIDLHFKKHEYERAGVLEYVVFCIEEEELFWFNLQSRRKIPATADSTYRSRVFPGLWLNGPSLVTRDTARLIATVQAGIATREHSEFVRRLKSRRS